MIAALRSQGSPRTGTPHIHTARVIASTLKNLSHMSFSHIRQGRASSHDDARPAVTSSQCYGTALRERAAHRAASADAARTAADRAADGAADHAGQDVVRREEVADRQIDAVHVVASVAHESATAEPAI